MKLLTPKLSEAIDHQTFNRNHIVLKKDINPINIRPAIAFMKQYFKNKALIGLELGVMRGNNARSILDNLNIKRLYLVDAWINYYYIPKNADKNYLHVKQLFKRDNRIKIIKGFSLEVCKYFNDKLDFIYIDSDHSYNAVYNDILNWIKYIKLEGVISGHDIEFDRENLYAIKTYSAVSDYCTNFNYTCYINSPDFYIIKR